MSLETALVMESLLVTIAKAVAVLCIVWFFAVLAVVCFMPGAMTLWPDEPYDGPAK